MQAISDNLIHFLGRNYRDRPIEQFEIFKSILEKGLMCAKIETNLNTGGLIFN